MLAGERSGEIALLCMARRCMDFDMKLLLSVASVEANAGPNGRTVSNEIQFIRLGPRSLRLAQMFV